MSIKQFSLRAATALVLSTVLAGPALADGVELRSAVFEEVEVTQNGKKVKQLAPLAKGLPGQEVVYETVYQNTGKKPADKIVVRNPLPAQVIYVPGSAQGAGTRAEVSVDGGKQFGALEKLTVTEADGTVRPARAEDVNALRWTVLAPVAAGGQGKVAYRARIK